MRINYFTVRNFRSIKTAKIFAQNYSLLVGPNNSGKSNLLRAIEFGLNPSMSLSREDYPAGGLPILPTEIEMDFKELTNTEKSSFDGYLRADKTLRLVRFASVVNDHPVNNGYKTLLDNGESKLLPNQILNSGVLPEFHFVPALFDLNRGLSARGNTYFGRLLKRFISTSPMLLNLGHTLAEAEHGCNFRDPFGNDVGLAELERRLNDDLAFFGGRIQIKAPQLSVGELYELGTRVFIDDGAPTTVDRNGHGLQRALLFAFIRRWVAAARENAPGIAFLPNVGTESVVFAIEEPELNIHPHGQRKVVKDLLELSETQNHQVFVCSHSPVFVRLENPERICVVSRPNTDTGTLVAQCTDDFFAGPDRAERVKRFNSIAYFNPDRSELFFADKIVLVEGQTEKKVLPYLAELLGIFEQGVSIIDCDGKYNLRLYMEVLDRFGLQYTVVHDEDPLPAKPSSAAQGIFNENQKIADLAAQKGNLVLVCSPDFEGLAEIVKQPNKPFNAFEHFKDKGVKAVNARLKEYVTSIYRPSERPES